MRGLPRKVLGACAALTVTSTTRQLWISPRSLGVKCTVKAVDLAVRTVAQSLSMEEPDISAMKKPDLPFTSRVLPNGASVTDMHMLKLPRGTAVDDARQFYNAAPVSCGRCGARPRSAMEAGPGPGSTAGAC